MIGRLRGQVASREEGSVVVDVRGVGYLVEVADTSGIPVPGETVELHTSTQVREDAIQLYGFADRDGLALFERLVGVSGVGPKLAMSALRTHRPVVLRRALAAADLETLKAVPGIGDKSAQRLVLELQGEIDLADDAPAADGPAGSSPGGPTVMTEVREALMALGYTAGEAQTALASLPADADGTGGGTRGGTGGGTRDGNGDGTGEDAETAELVRRALRVLGGGGQ